MRVTRRFLAAAAVWLTIMAVPLIALHLMADLEAVELLRGLAGVIVLAGYPAGIAAAKYVPAGRPWRTLLELAAGAGVLALLGFAVLAWVPGLVGGERATLSQLATVMQANVGNWETFNNAAWRYYSTLLTPVSSMLYSALGFQMGIWSGHAVPGAFRRALYWAVAFGLIVTGYIVSDSAYETIVLHTAADAGFAAFLPVLFPLGLVAGLTLPTVAWLRGVVSPDRRGDEPDRP
ncbi:MAG TPA: hypothetical protein VMM17_09905 [Gemmatimonadaceae bacterium]|nr:hypothetical protein [Gemmatimonadaceae bacterium]